MLTGEEFAGLWRNGILKARDFDMRRLTTPATLRLLTAGLTVALITVAGLNAARVDAADETYSWTFQFKPGQVDRFRTYMQVTGRQGDDSGDIALAIKSASRHDVKDVTADGTATWEQLDEQSDATVDGKAVEKKGDGPKPVTITFAKNGLLLKRVNPAADPSSRAELTIVAIQSMPVPEKPVKVGESWTAEIPNPVVKGNKITVKSTLAGVEKLLGTDALKVQVELQFPSTFGALEHEIVKVQETYFLDAKTYQLLRASYTIKDPMLPFPGKDMLVRVLVTRIVPGQNDKNDPEGEKLLVIKKP